MESPGSKKDLIKRSTDSRFSNVIHLATFKKLRAYFNLKSRDFKVSSETPKKIKTDKERVAEIQKQNNNYKDKR